MVHHIVQQPLTSSFMAVSMLGFLAGWYIAWPLSATWGFTFMFTCGLLFIASVYNFTHAPDEDMLAVHEPHRHLKHLKVYQK